MAESWTVQRTGPGDVARTQAREQLLEAARELYGVNGYRETAEHDVCEAAGVPVEVLRQEYGSREGLLIALHNRVTTTGLRAAESALLTEGIEECSIAERVRRLFDAYVESVTNDPREARVTFVEVLGVSAVVDEHCKLWRALWTEFLTGEAERAVERGEAEDRDHRVDVMVMVGTVHELMAHHARRCRRARPGEVSGELTQLALSMLGSQRTGE
ncbi:TetR/AcrR family transcriptional regulator [Streptomyces fimicarius]|uniref:TetR/AcrR family transcriptional regulator n=1 Tax=Streptomyces griseus TaxID=1911 RepID=UPI0035E03C12